MADTPEGETSPTPAPRRPRKPRTPSARADTATTVKQRATRVKKTVADAVTPTPATKRKVTAKVGATKTTVKRTAAKVARTVKADVKAVTPTTGKGKGIAVAAIAAGVAAGVAAVFGRKKIVQVANDAIDAVGGHKDSPPKPHVPVSGD